MDGPRRLSPSDEALWRTYVKDLKPLPGRAPCGEAVRPPRPAGPERMPAPRPSPRAVQQGAPRRGGGPPGALDRSLRRKLRTGRLPVDAELDLHGLRASQAELMLNRFIEMSHDRGCRCVLVITGKGRGSDGWPDLPVGTLRRLAPEWLRRPPARRFVAALGPAERRHGGDGALYVILRSRRRAQP